MTRWTLNTLGNGWRVSPPGAAIWLEPFAEATIGRVGAGGGVFDAAVFYGGRTIRCLSIGLRAGAGMSMHRMGRYGVALGSDSEEQAHGGH
ncbi:MAG: hypothetical protein H0W67_09325 [Gemmatimonadales bacterium]|nr:hypothetical protein [Gemmatimonadales bacterium]